MDLGSALLQYATESTDGTVVTNVEAPVNELNDAGATELTVVTDDVQTELEESLTDLADDVKKLNASNNAAEKLCDATESLEAMIRGLESLEARGIPLDNTAANMYLQGVALSLEAREIPAELFRDDLLTAQASFEANQLALPNPAASGGEGDNTKDAKSKTGNILTRLWTVLKNAVMGAIERLRNFVARMGKSASAIKASGAKLKEVAKKVTGSPSGKLKGSSYSALVVGGTVNVSKALDEVEKGWTSGVLEVTKELRAVSKGLIDAISKPDSGTIGAFARTINTKLHAVTHDLTGGYQIKFTPGSGDGFEAVTKAKFEIKRGDKPAAGADVEPLSASEIASLGGRLESIGGLMEKIAQDANDSVREANQVIEAAKRGADKGSDKVEAAEAQKLFTTAQSLVRQISSYAPQYVEFMGTVAKQAYALGTASASKHGAKAEGGAAAGGDDKSDKGGKGGNDTKAIGQEKPGIGQDKQGQIGNDKK